MAAVAASVRSGRTVLPTLITGHKVSQQAPKTPLTSDEAKQLQALMRGVVTDASGRFLADIPGGVGAKTGTAEFGTATDGKLPNHTCMLGTTAELALAVISETGESGPPPAGTLVEQMRRGPRSGYAGGAPRPP